MTQDSSSGRLSVRTDLSLIDLYDSEVTACAIDLSDNTNLWGVAPSAAAMLRDLPAATISRYPSAYASELKDAIARYLDVEPAMIVTGCGSDDVLDSAIRAYGRPGEALVLSDPSFSMIPVFARLSGLVPIHVPFGADGEIDPALFNTADATIAYTCSPNNPTGASFASSHIEALASEFAGLVIVDCAYAEFASRPMARLTDRFDNVLMTHTMSKAFGLAGLRIGYGVGHPDLVVQIEKTRGPYKVNSIAALAAVAALDNDRTWVDERVLEMRENRSRFVGCLADIGLDPLPSDANFILVPVEKPVLTGERLRGAGIAVRVFRDLPGIGGALRITIGPWWMMEACVDALQKSLS